MQAIDAREEVTSAVLAEELVWLFHALMRGTGGRVVEALNAHDLSLTEMKTLHTLDDEGGREHSVKELGACLAMSLPAASRTAEGLLQRGLVARREDAEDRRIKRLTITEEGRRVLRELEAVRLAGVETWADQLSPDQRAGLHAALAALRPAPTDAPAGKDPSHA